MFNRPPRIQRALSRIELKIVPPPLIPSKPKINWLTLGLPIFASGLVIALMFLLSSSTGGLSYLMFLPFIAASAIASALSYRKQLQEYEVEKQANLDAFQKELASKEKLINSYQTNQLDILQENDPAIEECLRLVDEQVSRLGERRPEDADFLSFRIGIGKRDSSIEVSPVPIENRNPLYDSLYEEADHLVEKASCLENAPITCDLKQIGTLGVVASIDELHQFGWASVIHLLTHHWPAELNIASFSSFVEVKNWEWLISVKHKTSIFPNPVIELRDNKTVKESLLLLEEELRRRKTALLNLNAIGSSEKSSIALPALIVIFDRVTNIYNHAAFSILLKEGRELGVYGLFLMNRVEDLPAECGAIISIEKSTLSYKITGPNQAPAGRIKADDANESMIKEFSGKLEKIDWLIPAQVTEPPAMVPLLNLFPYSRLDDLPIEKWWNGEHPFGYLRAPIGKFSPTADLIFDLNDSDTAHGPHGLIGGMTGSGKSELLKTIILSLALTHHPYELNFALIDYKGGGAFDEFGDLPHVVGVVTDLQSHADYAIRVIQSLYAEVKRRERVLLDAYERFQFSKPHIDSYNKLKTRVPIPRLVIIFDEYAEFQERHQEESKKLINIARLGRSLGVHLILCTQDPTGKAVDQQVRDNSNFKICLKVKTADTSKSLVGIPDAVRLHRGEAYFNVDGPQKFRVAYTGNLYHAPDEDVIGITTKEQVAQRSYLTKPTNEAKAITEEIGLQAKQLYIPKPPPVWPNALPEQLTLLDLIRKGLARISWKNDSWQEESYQLPQIPLGLMDDPAHQKQIVFSVENNLLIFGPSGSGKSIALMTLVMSIALMYTPAEAFIYCVDVSDRSLLKQLQKANSPDLPHLPEIGGVISGNDFERLNRLFKMLAEMLKTRAETFHNIEAFNSLTGNKERFPYVFLFVDGITQRFNADNPGFGDQLDSIMRSGPTYGIYVILTGNLPRDVPEVLQRDRTMIILQSIERQSILSVVGHPPETYQKKIDAGQEILAGRGLINTSPAFELQCATPIHEEKVALSENISNTINSMSKIWKGKRPPSVEVLPDFVSINELPRQKLKAEFTVGESQESLEPVNLSLITDGPIFMITSMTAGLGKTTALHLWLSELIRAFNPEEMQLVLIDFHSRNMPLFSNLPHLFTIDNDKKINSHVMRKQDLVSISSWLKKEVNERNTKLGEQYSLSPETFYREDPSRSFSKIVIAIDDYALFYSSNAPGMQELKSAIIDGEDVGVRLIIAEDSALIPNDELTRRAKQYACGLVFGGSDGLVIFNITRPPHGQKTANLPSGRGYLVKRGKAELIQAATYWKRDEDPFNALRRRIARS